LFWYLATRYIEPGILGWQEPEKAGVVVCSAHSVFVEGDCVCVCLERARIDLTKYASNRSTSDLSDRKDGKKRKMLARQASWIADLAALRILATWHLFCIASLPGAVLVSNTSMTFSV
jgi:hypothetical protein